MRPILLALLLLVAPLSHSAAPALSCQMESPTYASRLMVCSIPAAGDYEFVATFAGGHDDTMANLQLTLDGQALACAEGAQTRYADEVGEFDLNCRVSVAGKGKLSADLNWHHAEYLDLVILPR